MTIENTYQDLVRAFDDTAREAEATRYHLAVLETLNQTHDNGEQDGLAVMEGMARVLAQLVAGMPPSQSDGLLVYITQRAAELRPVTKLTGADARYFIENEKHT